jgi:integrase/recombinase XerD
MKYSVKLIAYKHQANALGQYPIYIRITIDRKQSYISTGHFIEKKHWDEKAEQVKAGHMQSRTINPDITSRKQALIKIIVDYQVKGQKITPSALKAMATSKTDLHNIFEFADLFAKEVEPKREASTWDNYRTQMKVVELCHGSRSLAFEEITHDWLVGFESYLRHPVKEGVEKRGPLGGNYIHAIWKTVKTFFNAAIKRKVTAHYPFATYENPEYEAPNKDYLTSEELDELEQQLPDVTDSLKKQTIIYFLLGCYTGLRISDLRKFDFNKHIQNGRLYLRAKKNGEWVTMPVVGRLAAHLERVKECSLTKAEQELNRCLKKMFPGKKITNHCARHTFAITMCAEKGISAETASELMGITLKTCVEAYYKVTNRKIDRECLSAWN